MATTSQVEDAIWGLEGESCGEPTRKNVRLWSCRTSLKPISLGKVQHASINSTARRSKCIDYRLQLEPVSMLLFT